MAQNKDEGGLRTFDLKPLVQYDQKDPESWLSPILSLPKNMTRPLPENTGWRFDDGGEGQHAIIRRTSPLRGSGGSAIVLPQERETVAQ